jgi:hypothetical protein
MVGPVKQVLNEFMSSLKSQEDERADVDGRRNALADLRGLQLRDPSAAEKIMHAPGPLRRLVHQPARR